MEKKQRRELKIVFWWTLSILWMALTMYLSNQIGSNSSALSNRVAKSIWQPLYDLFPSLEFDEFHFAIRKLAHFAVHAVLAFSIFRAAWHSFRKKGAALFLALVVAGGIAVFDELVQLRAPGRVWAVTDMGINLLGVSLGTCFSSILT